MIKKCLIVGFIGLIVSHSSYGMLKDFKRLIIGIETVAAEELKAELDDRSKVMVINVLNAKSYKDCAIPRSINIPIDQMKRKMKHWDKDKAIVVHCASYSCPLSRHAYKQLKDLGFANVRAYEGGLREWKQKGYKVSGRCKAGYLQG